ncbi:DUF4328 domain-containing protein [Nonomuraea typhae]|uniref:DUF4328 domain-containing protein n=1 Tax=Nonomuraea typhae TaxID=2603600 RepID=A0ABW7YN35_9ACTN
MYPPPPNPIRPVRGVAVFALTMLAVDTLVGVAAAGVDLWMASLMDQVAADPDAVSEAQLNSADLIYSGSGWTEVAAYLITIAAFLIWQFRVRDNAEEFSPVPHRRSRRWLTLGWVVPVVSLWFPKMIIDDVWTASKPGGVPDRGFAHARRSGLIWAWWLAWLCASWISNVAARLLLTGDDAEAMARAARFDVLSIGLYAVAAALAAPVIWKITAFQEARRASWDAAPSHPVA